MALTKCSDCGRDVSDQAPACPGCGRPMAATPPPVPAQAAPAASTKAPPSRNRIGCLLVGLAFAAVTTHQLTKDLGGPRSAPAEAPRPAPTASPAEKALKKIKLDFEWSTGGFGNVLMATFTVENGSELALKDFDVRCVALAKSQTALGQASKTLYDVVPAGGKKTFKDVNMGFIDNQASSLRCVVVNAHVAQ